MSGNDHADDCGWQLDQYPWECTCKGERLMATKNNPGKFDCYANAEPDEPMFVLLGRDRNAPCLVREWALVREQCGEDPAKVAEARACATAMEEFRNKRKDKQP